MDLSELGQTFIIIGALFIALRIAMYRVGTPFDSSEKESKNIIQMVFLVLLAETFFMFGLVLIGTPSNVVTSSSAVTYANSIITTITNTTTNTTLVTPLANGQFLVPWYVGVVFTIIVVMLIFIDTVKLFNTVGQSSLKLKR